MKDGYINSLLSWIRFKGHGNKIVGSGQYNNSGEVIYHPRVWFMGSPLMGMTGKTVLESVIKNTTQDQLLKALNWKALRAHYKALLRDSQ